MADELPPVTVLAPRRPGRPRAPEPRAQISVTVTAAEHDKLARQALRERTSVGAVFRKLARLTLPGERRR